MRFVLNIDVPDIEAGIRFYTDAFGLTLGRRFNAEFVELLGGPVPIYLLQKDARSEPFAHAPSVRSYDPHWTPVHFDVVVDDIDSAARRAQSAGAHREGKITDEPYGRLALMRDPFGNGFCLLQFNAKGYDALLSL
ncbi:MAG: VOC family protein [Alphaproteobacteria bacterium]|nr:VOC family protein [Alphaproteobacteria bacterium]